MTDLLEAEARGGEAGHKAAEHGVLGLQNLLYRGGGVLAEKMLGQDNSLLAQRVRAFFTAAEPQITRFVSDLPADIRHAFARLLADEPTEPASDRGLVPGDKPAWADDWGTDQFGRWVSFSVPAADGSPVSQRMRWIPPGKFTMGSPDGEDGRFDNEGPQREVAFADGFWLFDTPCTQALWLAVRGGDNPSRFQSRTRPVEQISFDDVAGFRAQAE